MLKMKNKTYLIKNGTLIVEIMTGIKSKITIKMLKNRKVNKFFKIINIMSYPTFKKISP